MIIFFPFFYIKNKQREYMVTFQTRVPIRFKMEMPSKICYFIKMFLFSISLVFFLPVMILHKQLVQDMEQKLGGF